MVNQQERVLTQVPAVMDGRLMFTERQVNDMKTPQALMKQIDARGFRHMPAFGTDGVEFMMVYMVAHCTCGNRMTVGDFTCWGYCIECFNRDARQALATEEV